MSQVIARIAVSDVNYWFDRPYSYLVPQNYIGRVRPGLRVAVPFGGVRPREGIVLSVVEEEPQRPLKSILDILDDAPILTPQQIRLALWMRERFFCTVSEAVRSILPAGLWYKISARYTAAPDIDETKAMMAAGKSKAEHLVLETVFKHGGECPLADIEAVFEGKNAGPALSSLVRKGVLCSGADKSRRIGDRSIQSNRTKQTCHSSMRRSACFV